jgi:hypothetical protein
MSTEWREIQFSGLILKGFGYSTFHTLLLGIPGGFVVFLLVLSSSVSPPLIILPSPLTLSLSGP